MNRPQFKTFSSGGFTLIEIAVVIFIMTLIATAGLKLLSSQIENATYSAVAKKQETIKQALVTYLGKFKRLPCPDSKATPDGRESRNTAAAPATCSSFFGRIPYLDLGLSRDTALDGWDTYFSYAVTPAWTLTLSTIAPVAGSPTTTDPALAFSVGSPGLLTVSDRIPASNATPTPIADPAAFTGAAALIISHGKNSLGGYTIKGTQIASPAIGTDEAENIDGANTIYFKRDYTDTDVPTYGAFDDIVSVIKPDDLTALLIKDGSVNAPMAVLNQTFFTLRGAIIAAAITNRTSFAAVAAVPADPIAGTPATPAQAAYTKYTLPAAAVAYNGVDPWGGTVTYTPALTDIKSNTPNGPAFTLTSNGPAGGSAVTFTVTVSELQGIFAQTGL